MKLLKKLAGVLLAMIMVLSMSTVAFAAQGTNDNSGSITINDAEKDIPTTPTRFWCWKATTQKQKHILTKLMQHGKAGWKSQTQYVSIDAQGYVTWVGGTDAANPAAFAKAALAHAERSKYYS